MLRLFPAIVGALAVGAAAMMKRPKSTAKKAMTAAKAARSKITRKRAARKR
jgi:hypothetical protein